MLQVIRKKGAILSLVLAIMFFAGCAKNSGTASSGKKMNKTAKGGIIGAGSGAIIGGAIGAATGNTAAGAIIGATVGGATGAVIGRKMDKQAEKLEREVAGAKVERVGEGIKLTFDSGILFAVNSSELTANAKSNIAKMAKIVNEPDNDNTNILIEGHTDSSGEDNYNQNLSEERARAVSNYAKTLGVKANRFTIKGYGETQPVASNDTEAGKRDNRRVEVAIFADKKMVKEAEKEVGSK